LLKIHTQLFSGRQHLLAIQELLKKEVVGIEDLARILGERPFQTPETQNIDRFRGDQRSFGRRVMPPGVWEWIESFRSPGLKSAGVGDEGKGDDGDKDNEGNDNDKGDDGGDDNNGGGLFWEQLPSGSKYPVAT
jgi:hypothetical protein